MSRRPPLRLAALFLLILVAVAAAGGWYRTTRPDYRLHRGEEAVQAGDFVEAEQYVRLLEAVGATDHVHLLRGEIELARDAVTPALAHFRRVSDTSRLYLEATFQSAKCLVMLRRLREAELLLKTVLERDDNHVNAHRLLAVIYFDQGDYSRTEPQLKRVTELDPTDSRPWRTLGLIYKELDNFDDAVAAYREMLRRGNYPGDVIEARIEYAECLLQQHEDARAIEALAGIELPAAVALRAEAMQTLGREDEVVGMLDAALKKYPDDGGLLRLRGVHHRAAGENVAAAQLLERVIAKNTNDRRSYYHLALAYRALQRDQDAARIDEKLKEIEKLLSDIHDKEAQARLNPWDPAPRLELANLMEKMNRPEMVKMWRRAAAACLRGGP